MVLRFVSVSTTKAYMTVNTCIRTPLCEMSTPANYSSLPSHVGSKVSEHLCDEPWPPRHVLLSNTTHRLPSVVFPTSRTATEHARTMSKNDHCLPEPPAQRFEALGSARAPDDNLQERRTSCKQRMWSAPSATTTTSQGARRPNQT